MTTVARGPLQQCQDLSRIKDIPSFPVGAVQRARTRLAGVPVVSAERRSYADSELGSFRAFNSHGTLSGGVSLPLEPKPDRFAQPGREHGGCSGEGVLVSLVALPRRQTGKTGWTGWTGCWGTLPSAEHGLAGAGWADNEDDTRKRRQQRSVETTGAETTISLSDRGKDAGCGGTGKHTWHTQDRLWRGQERRSQPVWGFQARSGVANRAARRSRLVFVLLS